MKTSIARSDVHLFERLVSKLVKPTDLPATIAFGSCPGGLQMIAFTDVAMLSLTIPTAESVDAFTLPWATIKEFATKKCGDIDLDVGHDSVTLSWKVNGVPQRKSVPSLGLINKRLPSIPDNIVAHPISMFDALVDAGRCVDPDNSRYSLGAICLRASKSQIISTDGRQALMQDGFAFPWADDVLCPVSKIFGSKELRDCADTVQIGFEADWLYLEVGSVAFWMKPVEGKFPVLEQFTRNIDHFTWASVDSGDADFVAQRLESLPGKTDRESPIYVDLNGHVAVRGHDPIQQTATELRLTRSRYDGKSLTMPMNRRFLKNALDFGINRIGFDPDERTPIVGCGDRKTFVIMPLEGDEPKVEPSKLTVLASDSKPTVPQKVDRPRQRTKPVAEPVTMPSVCRTIKPGDAPKSKAAILEEAEKLRETLRESLIGVNGLIREIKAQRRQDKLLRDTVASLRKLQGV